MRAAIAIGLILVSSNAYGQVSPCGPQGLTYDPYKPSDLAIVRQYGGAVLSQVPVSELMKLDPYVPSQGELLRQVGRGIPLWIAYGWPYAPAPASADCSPAVASAESPASASATSTPPPMTSFSEVMTVLKRDPAKLQPASVTLTPRAATPERNQGVMINYGGRTWVSAGPAVAFREAEFTQVGESAGFPVFRHANAKDLIYLPTTAGAVAPFRMAPR